MMEHKSNEGLTRQEKIEIGLIRPYSHTADRMVIEDIENGMTTEEIATLYNRDVEDLKQHIEQIKGKVKSYRLRGNTEAFAGLYAAIWQKAVEDELRHQMHRLLIDTSESLFSALLKYDRQDRNTYAKIGRLVGLEYGVQGIKLAQKLEMLIDESGEVIKKAVQAKIYKEAEDWPDNKRRCPEFEKAYVQIRDNILDTFSRR